MLRWITAGESHGPALVAVLEGMPAGVEVTTDDLVVQLGRRRLGFGRSPRMGFEQDEVEILGGVRHGKTQGGPVAVTIGNSEWPKWQTVMSPDPVDPSLLKTTGRNEALTRPRPGHADLPGMQKFGFDEARPVLERASRAGDGRPDGAGHGGAAVPAAAARCADPQPRGVHRRGGDARGRRAADAGRPARDRREPGALLQRRRAPRRWSPRSRPSRRPVTRSVA